MQHIPDKTRDIMVLIDLYIGNPSLYENVSPKEQSVYNELISFIAKKLSPIKEQIIKEQIEDNSRATVIRFISRYSPLTFHYSNNLAGKMQSCFSKKDFDYMYSRIEKQRPSVLN